ncbi:MAG: 30S ribosomal protein S26e [Candidatus Ranarchaeia archaeon]
MPKKRKSGGRKGGSKGQKGRVQCAKCGRTVPSDKAKKITRWVSLVEPTIARELRQQGAIIPRQKVIENYCISCAIHTGKVKIRSRNDRKPKPLY